jgi:hypothetical protein
MIMPFSVPLIAPLVVRVVLVVKFVLENSIFLYLVTLYKEWLLLRMATIDTEAHSTFYSTVNPVVLLLDGFDVIFLKLVGLILTCT